MSDTRDYAAKALSEVAQAADDFGMDCADRQNLSYKYGELADRITGEDWKAFQAALDRALRYARAQGAVEGCLVAAVKPNALSLAQAELHAIEKEIEAAR